jgi:hypothetical protein
MARINSALLTHAVCNERMAMLEWRLQPRGDFAERSFWESVSMLGVTRVG